MLGKYIKFVIFRHIQKKRSGGFVHTKPSNIAVLSLVNHIGMGTVKLTKVVAFISPFWIAVDATLPLPLRILRPNRRGVRTGGIGHHTFAYHEKLTGKLGSHCPHSMNFARLKGRDTHSAIRKWEHTRSSEHL